MPIAYSYMRFSSGKQAKGHSIERQRQMAEEYIKENPHLNLELDLTLNLTDRAVSAFSGKNMTDGNLGKFFDLVYTEEIEAGSYLLLENLDRFSRDVAWKATHDLTTLVKSGIVVVTLSDNQIYSDATLSAEGGSFKLMQSVIGFMRANDESEQKSQRVGKAWRKKMLRVSDGVQLTKRVPFWIVKEDRTKKIDEKVAVVKRIFKLSADGLGGQRITTILNEEGVAPPTAKATKWGISSVKKVLNSEAVIGVLNTADGVRHEGYYPRVITEKLWIKTRFQGVTSARTRDSHRVHPLSGLCVCAMCGATATRSGKSGRVRLDGTKNVWRTLVCADSMGKRSSCSYQSISYDKIVQAVLDALRDYQYKPPSDSVGGQLWQVGEAISALADDIRDIEESIKINKKSPSLRQELTKLMIEYDAMEAEQAGLRLLSRPHPAKEVEGGLKALFNDGLVDNKHFKKVVREVAINFNERRLLVTAHDGTMLEAEIDAFANLASM
jgi:DNA invertase Pin-like site-specific DNA recombinase